MPAVPWAAGVSWRVQAAHRRQHYQSRDLYVQKPSLSPQKATQTVHCAIGIRLQRDSRELSIVTNVVAHSTKSVDDVRDIAAKRLTPSDHIIAISIPDSDLQADSLITELKIQVGSWLTSQSIPGITRYTYDLMITRLSMGLLAELHKAFNQLELFNKGNK